MASASASDLPNGWVKDTDIGYTYCNAKALKENDVDPLRAGVAIELTKANPNPKPTSIQQLKCHLYHIQDSVDALSGKSGAAGDGGNAAAAEAAAAAAAAAASVGESSEDLFKNGTTLNRSEKALILAKVFSGKKDDINKWEIKKSNPDSYIIFKDVNKDDYTTDPYEANHYYYIDDNKKLIEGTRTSGGRRRNRKRKTHKRRSNKKAKTSKRR